MSLLSRLGKLEAIRGQEDRSRESCLLLPVKDGEEPAGGWVEIKTDPSRQRIIGPEEARNDPRLASIDANDFADGLADFGYGGVFQVVHNARDAGLRRGDSSSELQ
jgi:hypothetical protein